MHPFPTPLPWCLCSNFCNSFNLKGIPSISSFYSPPYFAHNPGSKDSCSFCMPLLMPPLCSLPCRWYPSYQTDCHGQTLHLLLGAHAICPDQGSFTFHFPHLELFLNTRYCHIILPQSFPFRKKPSLDQADINNS